MGGPPHHHPFSQSSSAFFYLNIGIKKGVIILKYCYFEERERGWVDG